MRISALSSNGQRPQRPRRIDVDLPAGRLAPARARRALDRLGGLEQETLEHARLAVSELVANSVRHAGLGPDERIHLEVEARSDEVRLEVADPGSGFDVVPTPTQPDRGSRWGLYLIERLSSAWGVTFGAGTRVWCHIPRTRSTA